MILEFHQVDFWFPSNERDENWGLKGVSDLPRVTEQVRGTAGFKFKYSFIQI